MTDKETIERQRMEIVQLRHRLTEVRAFRDEVLDKLDERQRELLARDNLTGPGYRWVRHWSNGKVSASSAVEAREETIRYFAGQALTTVPDRAFSEKPDNIAVRAREIAHALWSDLEKGFELERATRDAIETAKAEATDDK